MSVTSWPAGSTVTVLAVALPTTPNCADATVTGVPVRSMDAKPHASYAAAQHDAVAYGAGPGAKAPQLVTSAPASANVVAPSASNRSAPNAPLLPFTTTFSSE